VDELQVITGLEAQLENEARNQQILTAVKKFGIDICTVKAEQGMKFEAFQERCKQQIAQLEIDLQPDIKEMYTSGYVFDPKILQEVAKWFTENVLRFGGWSSIQCDIFWVNGFGKLQSKLSSRDAQVVNAGIGRVLDDNKILERTMQHAGGGTYSHNFSSRLGRDFYLGCFGIAGGFHCGSWGTNQAERWKVYVEQKQQHCKFSNAQQLMTV
jgi:hypothetical protein